MKQNVGPVAIIIAVIVLIGFCYFMFKKSQPNLQADYDPRNGPPAYATKGKQGQGGAPSYQTPGQGPAGGGQQPAAGR